MPGYEPALIETKAFMSGRHELTTYFQSPKPKSDHALDSPLNQVSCRADLNPFIYGWFQLRVQFMVLVC